MNQLFKKLLLICVLILIIIVVIKAISIFISNKDKNKVSISIGCTSDSDCAVGQLCMENPSKMIGEPLHICGSLPVQTYDTWSCDQSNPSQPKCVPSGLTGYYGTQEDCQSSCAPYEQQPAQCTLVEGQPYEPNTCPDSTCCNCNPNPTGNVRYCDCSACKWACSINKGTCVPYPAGCTNCFDTVKECQNQCQTFVCNPNTNSCEATSFMNAGPYKAGMDDCNSHCQNPDGCQQCVNNCTWNIYQNWLSQNPNPTFDTQPPDYSSCSSFMPGTPCYDTDGCPKNGCWDGCLKACFKRGKGTDGDYCCGICMAFGYSDCNCS